MAVREIAFELECFEWADERLEVAGRWKGLAGRRLDRPVLTVETEGGRPKHLVALPGGHFGAAEESWRAAFAWPGDPGEITGAELEVGGSVVVDLPLPDRRRRRRKRQAVDPGDEALRAEVGALQAQVERLRGELAGRERENMRLSAQLDERAGEEGDAAEAGAPTVEIERQQELTAEVERLAGERDRTRAELSAEVERLQGERAELAAEVQRLHGEVDRTSVELERVRDEGERARADVDDLREAFSDAAAEAEESRDRHRAELAALEDELRAERAAVARLTAQLIERPELPPPATAAGEDTQAIALPGAFDPPGPVRAGARPSDLPGAEHGPQRSRIPAWLRSGRARGDEPADAERDREEAGLGETGADEARDEAKSGDADVGAADETGAGAARGGADEVAGGDADDARTARARGSSGTTPPDDTAAYEAGFGTPREGGPARSDEVVARRGRGRAATREAVAPEGGERQVENGSRDSAGEDFAARASASLQAVKSRLESLFASNGHTAPEAERPAPYEDAIPGPRRSAAAARARAGATAAARRSPAELWGLRILAVVLVAVLLIAFLLILTSIA